MDLAAALRSLWRRKWILVVTVIVAAGAAMPFALQKTETFSSGSEAIVPSTPPLPNLNPSVAQGLLANKLADYVKGGLDQDVRELMGPEADQVDSVKGSQSSDFNVYTLEATAFTEKAAEKAAALAAQAVID